MPDLKIVSPRLQLGGYRGANNVTRGDKTGAFQVNGDYPEFLEQQPMDIMKGRWINYSDINGLMKTAVIGTGVEKASFDLGEDPIGKYISLQGVNFKVVGVFSNPNSQGDSEEEANTIFIPLCPLFSCFCFFSFCNLHSTARSVWNSFPSPPPLLFLFNIFFS